MDNNCHISELVHAFSYVEIPNDGLNLVYGTFDNYLHHWVDATAGGRFVPEDITSPVVSTSVLT